MIDIVGYYKKLILFQFLIDFLNKYLRKYILNKQNSSLKIIFPN